MSFLTKTRQSRIKDYDSKADRLVSGFSRGQTAQITKRIRLRGDHDFTAKDKKCLICGHHFNGPACIHGITENQEVLKEFSSGS